MYKSINSLKIFLVIGFMISVCTISICISSIYPFYREVIEENNFLTQFKSVNIYRDKLNLIEVDKKINDIGINDYILPPVTYEISQNGKIYINDVWVISRNFNLEKDIKISNKTDNFNNFNNGQRFVVIGKNLEKLTKEKQGKKYIDIFEKEYEVVGIIENNDFFKTSSIISIQNETFNNKVIEQYNALIRKDEVSLITNLKADEYKISINNIEKKSIIERILSRPVELEERVYQLLIGIFNLIVFSYFFANSIKKEVAIKRILGASNRYILKDIFKEIIALASVGILFGFILSDIIINIMNKANQFAYAPINNVSICTTILITVGIATIVTLVILSNVIRFKIMKEIR